jgi:hypothetical protein
MKVPFNNNLPTQIGDFIVNPQNPASNYVTQKGFIFRNLLKSHYAKCLKNDLNIDNYKVNCLNLK